MEIIFFGTGGGRINLVRQVRGTGGFRINTPTANIHVDPGPGALLHTIRNGQSPLLIDVVLVTHNHVDHFSDSMVMIEAMSNYGLKKRGIIIGSQRVINGDVNNHNQDRGIPLYTQSKADEVYAADDGVKKHFETEKGGFDIETHFLKHDEMTGYGFKLWIDHHVIGHITDTEYFPEMGAKFAGCELLIINCIKPEADPYKGHLTTNEVIEILKIAKPEQCIITHLGLKMIKSDPNLQAEKITKETGVKTIAARDGMRIRL